jgi:DNA-binding MarR family transcriptional regulator
VAPGADPVPVDDVAVRGVSGADPAGIDREVVRGGSGADPAAVDLEAARGALAVGGDPAPADLAVSLVGRLFRLSPRLVDLQDLGARQYGLGFARGRVLWALHETGPVLMRALSQTLGISPRTVTGLIDALEADGWVTRSPHPTDRRATVIALTEAAEVTLARLRASYEGLAHELLAGLPEEDLATCRAVITRIEQRLDFVVAQRVADFGPPGGPPASPTT